MVKTPSAPVDGSQIIALIGKPRIFLNQKIILIQDFDDRKRGDGKKYYGLPGGGQEPKEKPRRTAFREFEEETSLDLNIGLFKRFGCYEKTRPNGKNKNYLYVIRLKYCSSLITNDPAEVSKIHILKFKDIIKLSQKGLVHEGSIRLILLYLKGIKSSSLNKPVTYNGYTF